MLLSLFVPSSCLFWNIILHVYLSHSLEMVDEKHCLEHWIPGWLLPLLRHFLCVATVAVTTTTRTTRTIRTTTTTNTTTTIIAIIIIIIILIITSIAITITIGIVIIC